MFRELRRLEIDVAITYDLQIPDEIGFVPLVGLLPPHAVVSETQRFSTLSALALCDLAPEPLILLDLPLSREYFLGLFLKEEIQPNIAARSQNPELVRSLVASGSWLWPVQCSAALRVRSR